MRDRLPLFAFALALLIGAAVVFALRASSRGEFAEPFSTYRSEPDGARALFLLAQQAKLPVERRHIDFEAVEGTPELVLLGVEGDEPEKEDAPDAGTAKYDRWLRGRLSEYETKSILDAVNDGATLLYAVTRDHPFLGDLGVTFTPSEDHASRRLTPFAATPITAGVDTLQSRVSGYLSMSKSAASTAVPVLIDRNHGDDAVALLFPRGKGRVLVVATPTMASNRELAQDDAARLWLNALSDLLPRGGHIEFDEYHHGFTGERTVMGYAARYGFQWAIAQGIFGLLLWALAMRRFGAQQDVREQEQRASVDYLLAMARIYKLGGHRQHAAKALVRGAVKALQGLTRTRGRDVVALAEALEASDHGDLARELRAIDSWSRAAQLDDEDLLNIAARAAALRARAGAAHPQPSPGATP